MLSRRPKNPRFGLRLEFPDQKDYPHQADPRIHDCREENGYDMKEVLEYVREDKELFEEICKVVLRRVRNELDLVESSASDGLDDDTRMTCPVLDVTVGETSQAKVLRRTVSV